MCGSAVGGSISPVEFERHFSVLRTRFGSEDSLDQSGSPRKARLVQTGSRKPLEDQIGYRLAQNGPRRTRLAQTGSRRSQEASGGSDWALEAQICQIGPDWFQEVSGSPDWLQIGPE